MRHCSQMFHQSGQFLARSRNCQNYLLKNWLTAMKLQKLGCAYVLVGLMFKTGVLDILADVRSKPLGQKRRRGRPKKLPACLAKSPEPQITGTTATARYHNPTLLQMFPFYLFHHLPHPQFQLQLKCL